MKNLQTRDLFLVLKKDEVSIEPDSFVHCNTLPKDTSKYSLRYVENPKDLNDVETVLVANRGIVLSETKLLNICYDLWNYLQSAEGKKQLGKMEIDDVMYRYLFAEDDTPKKDSDVQALYDMIERSSRMDTPQPPLPEEVAQPSPEEPPLERITPRSINTWTQNSSTISYVISSNRRKGNNAANTLMESYAEASPEVQKVLYDRYSDKNLVNGMIDSLVVPNDLGRLISQRFMFYRGIWRILPE